ncbi:hypothetical protein GCM10022381_13390 [Leifsonia kafniensis]|uniref:Uncharacterized protein n=1 Tax=Leifsonia kafniensis TaxID=475957 RepID=A0ABP7KBE9_9MICO
MAEKIAPLPLSRINLDALADVRSNSDGGFYDPTDGQSYLGDGGEAMGPDGDNVDPDEMGWHQTGPVESRDSYRDMETFAQAVTDPRTSDRLLVALDGKGAFRRFLNVMYDAPEELGRLQSRYYGVKTKQHALEWLIDEEFVVEEEGRAALIAMTALATHILELVASWKPTDD